MLELTSEKVFPLKQSKYEEASLWRDHFDGVGLTFMSNLVEREKKEDQPEMES